MRNLVAIPLLGAAVIVQSTLVSNLTLLSGAADLLVVMLVAWALQKSVTTAVQWAFLAAVMMSLISKLPWFIYTGGYLGAVALALLLQRRVWQLPILAMFSVTFLATLVMHALTFTYLGIGGSSASLADALGLVTLPSVLLNLLLAIPVFGLMRDLAGWVNPSMEAT